MVLRYRPIRTEAAEPSLQLPHVVQQGDGAEFDELLSAGSSRLTVAGQHRQEGNPSSLSRRRVIDVITEVDGLFPTTPPQNLEQTLWVWFRAGDIFHRNNMPKIFAHAAALERVVRLLSHAAGKQGEFCPRCQTCETRSRQEPLLTRDVAPSAVLAPVELDKLVLYFLVTLAASQRLHPRRRQLPIVVESRLAFPALEFFTGHALASKEAYGLEHRLMKRSAHVYKHTVDVEDNDLGMSSQMTHCLGPGTRVELLGVIGSAAWF